MRQTKTLNSNSSGRRHAATRTEECGDLDLGITPRTELGRLLLAARRAYFEAEGRFLTREKLERQLAELRGDDPADAEQEVTAYRLNADELVTTEGRRKPIHRVERVRVVSL